MLKDAEITEARAAFLVEKKLLSKSDSDNYISKETFKNTFYWIFGIALVLFLIK
jgi:hypothetical protein